MVIEINPGSDQHLRKQLSLALIACCRGGREFDSRATEGYDLAVRRTATTYGGHRTKGLRMYETLIYGDGFPLPEYIISRLV